MRLLISVRNVDEALTVADGGADFIDLKEPGAGALGGLPVATIAAIVDALRSRAVALPVSATIGDIPSSERAAILARVAIVAACGVDYVKVGIERDSASGALLDALAACGHPVVPVFIADRGIDAALVHRACALGFPAVMVDTADKRAGSLFDRVDDDALRRFVAEVRASGAIAGLAGALRLPDLPRLAALAPDFAGFRSAVCIGDRSAALDLGRLARLVASARACVPVV